ncbi:hypothetical protein V1277_001600 [Bradyrhizobium sp. AZCC 1588]|uniref:hypothetical protein n=1 Tax=unclassified Bradyrhizobium TaxID=2631580 RepID=UPI002FF16CBA
MAPRRATNKRQPTVPLPDRLLVHMRCWYDKKIIANHFVEWQGAGIKSVKNGREISDLRIQLRLFHMSPRFLAKRVRKDSYSNDAGNPCECMPQPLADPHIQHK